MFYHDRIGSPDSLFQKQKEMNGNFQADTAGCKVIFLTEIDYTNTILLVVKG